MRLSGDRMNLVELINGRRARHRNAEVYRLITKIMWVQKYLFFRKDLTAFAPLRLPRMRLNVDFSFGTENDVRRIAADPHLDARHYEECYLQKMHEGDRLVVAKNGEEVVFYLWVVAERKCLMDKVLILRQDEIAVERAYTRKEFRGHGLYLYALNFLFPAMAERGFSSCLTEIATHNTPMIKTIGRAAFEQTDSCYYLVSNYFLNYSIPMGPLKERCVRKKRYHTESECRGVSSATGVNH